MGCTWMVSHTLTDGVSQPPTGEISSAPGGEALWCKAIEVQVLHQRLPAWCRCMGCSGSTPASCDVLQRLHSVKGVWPAGEPGACWVAMFAQAERCVVVVQEDSYVVDVGVVIPY